MSKLRTLQSGIMRTYVGRFILDEDALRRLQAALEKHATTLEFSTHVVFRVEREDDRFYETTELSDVLSDANLPSKRVQGLSIELRRKDPIPIDKPWEERWVVDVRFGLPAGLGGHRYARRMFSEAAELTVISSDRNWALLVADELEPQVQRVVARPRLIWLFYLCFVLLVCAVGLIGEVLRARTVDVQGILQPYTVWKLALSVPLGLFAAHLFQSMPFRIFLPEGFGRWIGGESVFLWGEELKQFPQRQRFRRNVIWSVVVAFLVSLLASLVAWLVTGPSK